MRKKKNCVSAENTYQFELSFTHEVSDNSFKSDSNLSTSPAAGWRNGDGDVNNRGSNGNYWSGTLKSSDNAYNLNFNSDNRNPSNNNNRYNGHSVRPVSELIANLPHHLPLYILTREQLLVDLYKAYRSSRRGKRNSHSQLQFELCLEEELVNLRNELWDRQYQPSSSICFVIHDPKQREIFAASFRDRVVHHLYYNYTNELFERQFISDSYSCRKHRGTSYGISRLQHHLRSCSNNWKKDCYVLKMDIQGYFMSISRNILLERCQEMLMRMAAWEQIDYSFILWLSEIIILNDPTLSCRRRGKKEEWKGLPPSKSLFHSKQGCGLPIGNLTSQLFSNIYMNSFDNWMKRELHCHHYGRYVDDCFVVHRSKKRLLEIRNLAGSFLQNELGLKLHPNKTFVIRALYGTDFLGSYLKPFRTYIRNSTRKRMVAHIRELDEQALNRTPISIRDSLNSFLGYFKQYKTFYYRSCLFGKQSNWKQFGCFDVKYNKFYLYSQEPISIIN